MTDVTKVSLAFLLDEAHTEDMTTTKHSAPLPDGGTATRTSKTRIYTHIVAVERTAEWYRQNYEEQAQGSERYVAEYRADLASNGPRTQRYGAAQMLEWIAMSEAQAVDLRQRAATAHGDPWGAGCWCGSYALAVKQLALYTAPGVNAQIIGVLA